MLISVLTRTSIVVDGFPCNQKCSMSQRFVDSDKKEEEGRESYGKASKHSRFGGLDVDPAFTWQRRMLGRKFSNRSKLTQTQTQTHRHRHRHTHRPAASMCCLMLMPTRAQQSRILKGTSRSTLELPPLPLLVPVSLIFYSSNSNNSNNNNCESTLSCFVTLVFAEKTKRPITPSFSLTFLSWGL